MKVLGRRSNLDLIIDPIIFVIFTAICVYFGSLVFEYYYALFTDDMETFYALRPVYEQYCFRTWRHHYVTPFDFTLCSLLISFLSLVNFLKRVVQPSVLIECDNSGFYLNMPHNKTWYVVYNEIVAIHVSPFETPLYIKKRNANLIFYDPDDYIEITATPMPEGVQGTIKVHIFNKTFQIDGVANALQVAREMQLICNDGRRKQNEWLDEKALEKREKELREKTKT